MVMLAVVCLFLMSQQIVLTTLVIPQQASPRGPLTQIRYDSTTAKLLWLLWWWFSRDNLSTVERVDFSNDSATQQVRGPLTYSGYRRARGQRKKQIHPKLLKDLTPAMDTLTVELLQNQQ